MTSTSCEPLYQITVISLGDHATVEDALDCSARVSICAEDVLEQPWIILPNVTKALRVGCVVVLLSRTEDDWLLANAMLDKHVLTPWVRVH